MERKVSASLAERIELDGRLADVRKRTLISNYWRIMDEKNVKNMINNTKRV